MMDLADSITETRYDTRKNPLWIKYPDGTITTYTYYYNHKNSVGQKVAYQKETDANGNQTLMTMDACGRIAVEEKKDKAGILLQKTDYFYDGEGNLTWRSNKLIKEGQVSESTNIKYLYDAKNREISVTEAVDHDLQKTTLKEYHPNGSLAKVIKPDGVILSYEYDDLNRLKELCSSDGTIHYRYDHDQNNNLIKVDDLVHGLQTHRIIDNNDRMISEELGTGLKFTYAYDPRSRIKQVILPDLSEVNYNYNAANLESISRIKNGNQLSCSYHFNVKGKIEKIDLPNNIGSIDYTYDACLRPKTIITSNWTQEIPDGGYDPCGNVLLVSQNDSAGHITSQYSYDSLYHLTSESGAHNHTYTFDSHHNRTQKNGTENIINALNQLTHQGGKDYAYDPNGNQSKLITPISEIEYQYDALDRLTAIINGSHKTQYLYDAFHRRLKRTSFNLDSGTWIETDTTLFMYQGDNEIGSLDQSGNVIQMRTLGLGIDGEIGAAVLLELNNSTFTPIHDFRGNVTALVDISDGHLTESYRYTAYGEDETFDPSGVQQTTSLSPWRFSSKRIDLESGLTYFGRRYYDPEIGKWTTPDPLGYIDSSNVYCFVRNRPLKYIDPDGRAVSDAVDYDPNVSNGSWLPCWSNSLSTLGNYVGKNYEHIANFVTQPIRYTYDDNDNPIHVNNNYLYSSTFRVGTPMYKNIIFIYENGIRNTEIDALDSAELISKMAGGHEVILIHNQSYGFFDLVECALGTLGVQTPPCRLTKKVLESCPKDCIIIFIAHSQGNIHSKNVLPYLDEELRQRIIYLGVAPGGLMPKDTLLQAKHFVSRDFVPQIAAFNNKIATFINGADSSAPIIHLTPHPNAAFWDHPINSPTYGGKLTSEIQSIIQEYGKPL